MSACEECWADAAMAARWRGGSVVDHYERLLKERKQTPCTPLANDHLDAS